MPDFTVGEELKNVILTGIVVGNSNTDPNRVQILPVSIVWMAYFDFQSDALHAVGANLTDPAGYIYNEKYDVDGVGLQLVCGSATSRVYKDASKGINLVQYKDYAVMKFTAPEGKSIRSISFNTYNDKLQATASSGELDATLWQGNADGVRFTLTGTPYIYSAEVVYVAADEKTVSLADLEYTEVDGLAEFNALPSGTPAKIKLTNAQVIGISADGFSTVFLQDETGGSWMQYTSLNGILAKGNLISGYVYAIARQISGNTQMKETEDTPNSEIDIVLNSFPVISDCETAADVIANKGRLVALKGVDFTATSASVGTIAIGDTTITVNNGTAIGNQLLHAVADFTPGNELNGVTIIGIVSGTSATVPSQIQILPLAITEAVPTAEAVVAVAEEDAPAYNLAGQPVGKSYKGLVVKGGKLVWQK